MGGTTIVECIKCHGLWVDKPSFEEICQSREQQAAVLGDPRHIQSPSTVRDLTVRYVRCPVCNDLMHRVNFAKCSGVVVDICQKHGTWFDRDELKHIVEFIRSGGVDRARQKEIRELEQARRRTAEKREAEAMSTRPMHTGSFGEDLLDADLISMAGRLLLTFLK